MSDILTVVAESARQCHWQPDNAWTRFNLPEPMKNWLCDTGSLTAALRTLGNDTFSLTVLSLRYGVPYPHEQMKLNRPLDRAGMIREVSLSIFDTPVVYARSIIPLSSLKNGKNGLANLGRTPLGHLLFKDGRMRVSKREFARVRLGNDHLHARRTPYDYQGSTILVSEFFLPNLLRFTP